MTAKFTFRILPWFVLICLLNTTALRAAPIPNPYMVLIRDSAVHRDLRLTSLQINDIQGLTDRLDPHLWKIRGLKIAEAHMELAKIIATAESALPNILSASQISRFQEIILRVQGTDALRRPDIVKTLAFSVQQQQDIQTAVDQTKRELAEISKRKTAGESATSLQGVVQTVQQRGKKTIFDIFTSVQQLAWSELLGKPFDTSNLGNVRYKAPEFLQLTQWLNSQPLSLSQLKGSVVVVHFMAYG